MKKITRMLAALAAVATMTVSAVPVCAEAVRYNEAEDENTYITLSDDKKAEIKMINDIKNCITECITENNLKAQFGRILLDRYGKQKFIVNYYYTNTEVKPLIERYLTERGLDLDKVEFNCAGTEHTDSSEMITDVYEKAALFDEFFNDNDLPVSYCVDYDYNSVWANDEWDITDIKPVSISISIESMDDQIQTDTRKAITMFADEHNIDMHGVHIAQYLGNSNISDSDLGDVNGDGTLNIRDCAEIAKFAAQGKTDSLPDTADYNKDGKKNVRDGAAIAKELAKVK